ncbi:hypothetical protein H1R20_g13461, partial [Candolleomyces eurysporus]
MSTGLQANDVNVPTNKTRKSKGAVNAEPAAKKRKTGLQSSQPVASQGSFADVLERLHKDAADGSEARVEGGADSWARPPLPKINPKTQPIIFQQIDVENSTDYSQGGTVLRMFGVTEDGHSVLANITEFLPYFYVSVPRGFTEDDIAGLRGYLNGVNPGNDFVKKIEKVNKRSIWGYKGDDWIPFLKLTICEPKDLPKVRDKSPFTPFAMLLTYLLD